MKKLGGLFDLENKWEEIQKLTKVMNEVDFWNNREKADEVVKKLSGLKNIVEPVQLVYERILSNRELVKSLGDSEEFEIINLLEEESLEIKALVEELRLSTYLAGEYDANDCILEIHAGAGGTESCDWAAMLYRMYSRYCKKIGYEIIELDIQKGEEVGYKSVTLQVRGVNAFGYLKGEKGVHRLVRISPFDSNKRRHTSFASVEVTPEIDKNVDVVINDGDLKIDIYRSSGPGGQGVNTTDSAVRITHLPTGIVVTCQNERSQIQNKEHCMEILRSKLYTLELEKKNKTLSDMKKGQMTIGFGSGKRSYVMCPYTKVSDNDSGYECVDVNKVLDGEIDEFIKEGLRCGNNDV